MTVKGGHHTNEAREKNRLSHIGKKHSEESKRKQGESITGEKNHFFGKHHTKESREKIRISRLGIYCGKNHPRYGTHLSEEEKLNLRNKNLGKKHSMESRIKHGNSIRGEKNHLWKGGRYPIKLSSWEKTRTRFLEDAGFKSQLSGRTDGVFQVHHMISRRNFCDVYSDLMYGDIFDYKKLNNMMMKLYRKHNVRRVLPLVYPHSLFAEMDDPSNLIVLTLSEHRLSEGMPPSFFLQI
jgi:hypothetical protein